VKKLLVDLQRELNRTDRPATRNFSAAIKWISDFLGRAGAGPDIRIHLTHLGSALLDVSQGRRTPLFDVPIKTGGRPHILQ
jgi:hypothetical protein